jgi:hypothetical protein
MTQQEDTMFVRSQHVRTFADDRVPVCTAGSKPARPHAGSSGPGTARLGLRRRRSAHAVPARILPTVFALLGLAATERADAQQTELPKAEAIIERHVEATGGRAAYEKLRNRVSTGELSIPAMNVKGTVKSYHATPNRMLVITEIPDMGPTREGCDGEVAWELSAMMGPRIKEDAERAFALREATFNGEIHWRKLYKKSETLGQEEVEGKPVFKVELTPEEGKPIHHSYDRESGRLVKVAAVLPTLMGEIPFEVLLSDYREVDGVSLPHRIVQRVLTQELMVTFTKIEHNVEIPKGTFDLPEPIRELLAARKLDRPATRPATAPAGGGK